MFNGSLRMIYMYIYMYSFFYGTFRSSMHLRITTQCTTNSTFHADEVVLTISPDSSIAHTYCGTKGNKLKRRWEREREARHYQSEYKREEARLEVRIILNYSQASDHSNLVYIARLLIQCCAFPSIIINTYL